MATRFELLDDAEREEVSEAHDRYVATIPEAKKSGRINYAIKDNVERSGIGSAGLPAYSVLIEGLSQASESDSVLTMKQGNVAAPSAVVDDEQIGSYVEHHGHRTTVSQRALRARSDPLLGYTSVRGVDYAGRVRADYALFVDAFGNGRFSDVAPT